MNIPGIPRVVFCLLIIPFGAVISQTVVPVQDTGSRAARVNLVFLSEGYRAGEMVSFGNDVNHAVSYLFSREPWSRYRNYFNIYRIEVPSLESGTDNGTAAALKQTYFDTGFNNANVPQLLTAPVSGQGKAYNLLNINIPEYDIAILLVNDGKYGGSGGPIPIASNHPSGIRIVEHELGHSFAGLSDEYDTDLIDFQPYESPNSTSTLDAASVRWRSWFESSTPIATPATSTFSTSVGLFEGAVYRAEGWYRPHLDSVMRTLGRPAGQVNRQELTLSIYKRVGAIGDVDPPPGAWSISGVQPLEFSLDLIEPIGGPPHELVWKIDGIAEGVGSVFQTSSVRLGAGFHQVTAEVRDVTPWVRDDPNGILNEFRVWSFEVSDQLPPDLPSWRQAYGGDFENPSGDGLCNLVKYALGLDPTKPSLESERPRFQMIQGAPGIHIKRNIKRDDIDYLIEFSTDLVNWTDEEGMILVQDNSGLLTARVSETAHKSGFMRLKISVRPN